MDKMMDNKGGRRGAWHCIDEVVMKSAADPPFSTDTLPPSLLDKKLSLPICLGMHMHLTP